MSWEAGETSFQWPRIGLTSLRPDVNVWEGPEGILTVFQWPRIGLTSLRPAAAAGAEPHGAAAFQWPRIGLTSLRLPLS